MNVSARRAIVLIAAALLPVATVAPIVWADPVVPNCPGGWWDPAANICRPPVATTPLNCDNGWWWDPVGNVCRPPVIPPQ